MASTKEGEALMPDPSIGAASVAHSVHPRMLARAKHVRVARARATLLAQIDKLIGSLDNASPFTDRFSGQAASLRDLRDRVAFAGLQSPDGLFLMSQINRHMADIIANLTVADPQ